MDNPLQRYPGIFCVQQQDETGQIQDWSYAIHLEINRQTQRALWTDGQRGRLVDYEKLNDCVIELNKANPNALPTRIRISDAKNHCLFILEPLTLERYQTVLKDRIAGRPNFDSEKEMIQFFLSRV